MRAIEPKKFKRKPTFVEAIEWDGSNEVYDFLKAWSGNKVYRVTKNSLGVITPGLVEHVNINDWIICENDAVYPLTQRQLDEYFEITEAERTRSGDMWPEVSRAN